MQKVWYTNELKYALKETGNMKYAKRPNVPFRIEKSGNYKLLGINNLFFNEVVKDHLYYVSFDAKDKRLYDEYHVGGEMGPTGTWETLAVTKTDLKKNTFIANVEFAFQLNRSQNQSWGFSLIESRWGIRGIFIDETWCLEGRDPMMEGLRRYVRVKGFPKLPKKRGDK